MELAVAKIMTKKDNETLVKRDVDPLKRYPLSPAMLFANTEPRLELGDFKIIQGVLSVIVPSDTDRHVYLIPSRSIAKAMGISTNKCQQKVKSAMNRVMDYKVSIPEPDGVLTGRWIVNFKYIDGVGDIRVRLDPDLMPYFTSVAHRNAKVFAIYGGPARFTCEYTPELYSLFLWHCDEAEPMVKTIESLRSMWKLTDKHKTVSSFNQRVLHPALNDINKFTELEIESEPVYEGRKIVAYRFAIGLKAGEVSPKKEYNEICLLSDEMQGDLFEAVFVTIPTKAELLKQMTEAPFNLDQQVAVGLINTYDEMRISNALEYVKTIDNVKSYPSYTYRAIERDYGTQWAKNKSFDERKKKASKAKIVQAEAKMLEELEKGSQLDHEASQRFLKELDDYKNRGLPKQENASSNAAATITKEKLLEILPAIGDNKAREQILVKYGHLLQEN